MPLDVLAIAARFASYASGWLRPNQEASVHWGCYRCGDRWGAPTILGWDVRPRPVDPE